jgi:formimidoylglutamase
MTVPHARPAAWPLLRSGRFAATIRTDGAPALGDVALLGLPDDTGVRLNGGRPGAADGPRAFRAALATFGTTFDLAAGKAIDVRVFDAGDVEPAAGGTEAALAETHARVEAAALALHEAGCVTVGIGGGHDLTLPSVTAAARRRGRALGGVNLDAHLDVRERVGSGMPFRRLIEGGHLDPHAFVELGLGRFANDAGDVEWARAQGAWLVSADQHAESPRPPALVLERALAAPGAGFVSIDLDGLDGASAPGVSALNPCGLDVRDACRLAEAAGRDPRVVHFDIMELAPPHDLDGRTARTAALLFLTFVAGVAARRERPTPR